MSVVPFMFGGFKDLEAHRNLLQDSIRTDSFRRAIFKGVKKGDVVVDLGAGSGILSFFAHQAGAKRIYAIERGMIIEVARIIAQRNNMDDKIIFIDEDARTIKLPEKADVIVSECIGPFVFGGSMVSAVTHMRDRSLRRGGVIIPSHLSLFLVPVQSFSHYEEVNYWKRNFPYGINLSPAQEMSHNNVYSTIMDVRDFISHPQKIAAINLSKDHPDEMLNVQVEFPITRSCSMHGLCGWFDVDLCKGVAFSTSPSNETTVWQQVFFPLEEAISQKKGSVVTVDLLLKRSEDDLCSCFNWTVETTSPNGKKERKSQSTKRSFPFNYKEICSIRKCNTDGRERNKKLEKIAKRVKELEDRKLKEIMKSPEDYYG